MRKGPAVDFGKRRILHLFVGPAPCLFSISFPSSFSLHFLFSSLPLHHQNLPGDLIVQRISLLMGFDHKGRVVVIMGVSGAGKSTIGDMLAKVLNCTFIDADDLHPLSNKEKMRQGIPLPDEDRIPWLEMLQDVLKENLVGGKTVILGCSSLQKHYREILRSADAAYEHGSYASRVQFVLLDAEAEVLASRLEKRDAEGKHFMPVTLLQSQLDLLHIDDAEGIFKVDATLSPQAIVSTIQTLISE